MMDEEGEAHEKVVMSVGRIDKEIQGAVRP
jgi:hypothetical protein